jgi:diaminopimelate decarboxylase
MNASAPTSSALTRVAAAIQSGSLETPCYVYDIATLTATMEWFESALGAPPIVSLKANPNTDLLLRIQHLQDGVEVASLDELNSVAKSGRIFINTPAMDRNLMRAGIGAKATFIVDDISQINDLDELLGARPAIDLLLRLNASVVEGFLPNARFPSIRSDHFGMDWTTALAAIERMKARTGRFRLLGWHLFAGSYTFERVGLSIARAAPELSAAMEAAWGAPIGLINLGGGFSEDLVVKGGFDFDAYRRLLSEVPPHIRVLHESGRGIFASCGFFAATVLRVKRLNGRSIAVCDGGINQAFLLCQTENTFRRPRVPLMISRQSSMPSAKSECVKTLLVGSSCSRDDVIGEIDGPLPQPGDICLFANCGAYHATYTVAPFLSLKRARQYVLA